MWLLESVAGWIPYLTEKMSETLGQRCSLQMQTLKWETDGFGYIKMKDSVQVNKWLLTGSR